MNQRLLAQIGRSARLSILNRLKRSAGLSVGELSEQLEMSYMGVKQHCIELKDDGYLDTWRRPKAVGRPEMLYRLTRRAQELFPTATNAVTLELLESAKNLFGPAAPEKLLLQVFERRTAFYEKKLRQGSPIQRAQWLARLRDAEGCMSDFVPADESGGPRIVEYHSPLGDVLAAWPAAVRLETAMLERLIGSGVRREEVTSGAQIHCIFWIDLKK